MNKQEQQLISIGYRELESNIWGKPVGFHLFLYDIKRREWSNHFIGKNKQSLIWETSIFNKEEEDELIESIGVVEQYTRIDMGTWEHPLNFTTQKENIEQLLNE